MTDDYHVSQFPPGWTGICPPRNCACASDAMAIAFAGGPQLTAAQVRAASGISCVKDVDTTSGGLRVADQIRVGKLYGVDFNFGGYDNWPTTALAYRLKIGQGVIVLGDCNAAPVDPCSGEVYHSAFCHGYRIENGVEQTHWHDPRKQLGVWVAISAVIRYWQNPCPTNPNGWRYAGFVAPNQTVAPPETDTGGADDMPGPVVLYFDPDQRGVMTTKAIAGGVGFIHMTGAIDVHGVETWGVFGKGWMTSPIESHVYLIRTAPNDEPMFVKVDEVNFTPAAPPSTDVVGAYNEGRAAVVAAANAVPEKV